MSDEGQTPEERAHVGPPDLILQAILPPGDAPAEIRQAVAHALAGRVTPGGEPGGWEHVSFAGSALAFVEGTDQRADPDTQWVFALAAESPRIGEQIHSCGGWSTAIHSTVYAQGTGRLLWRASVHSALRTRPRGRVS